MALLYDLLILQAKSRLRSLDRHRQDVATILAAILALFLFSGAAFGGYFLPLGLHAAFDVSAVEVVNSYLGIYLAGSFVAKAIFLSLPAAVFRTCRTLPIPLGYLSSLAMLQTAFNVFFGLECAFLLPFSLACAHHFDFSLAWAAALLLTLACISLYALLCKIAFVQGAHRYPYQRHTNYTVLACLLLLAGAAAKPNFIGELYDLILANDASALLGVLLALGLSLWWWQKLMQGLLRYA
jgi:hypothetical protein